MTTCQKAPINGDLDGQWQVIQVDPDPQVQFPERLYYNFSLHVCSLSYYGGYFQSANMIYEDDKISLDFPYPNATVGFLTLSLYGINSNPVTFNVHFENHNRMILYNNESTVVLQRH